MNLNPITIIVFSPILGGVLSWLITESRIRKFVVLIASILPLSYLIYLYPKLGEEPITFSVSKLGELNLGFYISNLGWFFATLVAVVGLASVLGIISTSEGRYESLFALSSLTGAFGVFLSLDLLSFFIFLEILTFSSFMMILKNDKRSSLKYLLLSLFGAYAMLMAIGVIYVNTGELTILSLGQELQTISQTQLIIVYGLFAIAFGVKVGMFPLHVWAPGGYSNVDQSYASMFSGALSKTGVFGLIMIQLLAGGRLAQEVGIFQNMSVLSYIVAFAGGLTIVVGGILAALQQDIRKLFAYSSISQLGYVVMGIGVGTALSMQAAIFHALSHALFKGLFFLTISAIIYRTGKTKFKDMGGLAEKMPFTFAMSFIAILSLAGIPPMVGFASKWLLFESIISQNHPILGGFAFFGSAIGFVYLIRYIYAVWFGQRPTDLDNTKFTSIPLALGMVILGTLNIVFGVAPGLIARELNSIMGQQVISGSVFMLDIGFGKYNALILTIWLVVGLGIAAAVYFIGAKVKRVPITNTYQSGNPVTMDYNLNIGVNFFRPLEETLGPFLQFSVDDLYKKLGRSVDDLADVLRSYIYNGDVQSYSWYIVLMVFVLILWWGW